MNRVRPPHIALAVLAVTLLLGGYAVQGANRIAHFTAKTERYAAPSLPPPIVKEIGYVQEVRTWTDYWRGRKEMRWWIHVPATDALYSCYWLSGYSGFRRDDAVLLVRHPDAVDTQDWSARIIGLHGHLQGKSAAVDALDVADLDDMQ